MTHQSLCLPLEEGQDGESVFLSAETFPWYCVLCETLHGLWHCSWRSRSLISRPTKSQIHYINKFPWNSYANVIVHQQQFQTLYNILKRNYSSPLVKNMQDKYFWQQPHFARARDICQIMWSKATRLERNVTGIYIWILQPFNDSCLTCYIMKKYHKMCHRGH